MTTSQRRTAIPLMILLLTTALGAWSLQAGNHGPVGLALGAESLAPSDVRITNVRDTQFTVSWVSDQAEIGQVNYGTSFDDLGSVVFDDRGETTNDDTHHVTIIGLLPETTYYFDVVSGNVTDDNAGNHYTVTTGPSIIPTGSDQVWGQVFLSDGSTPAEGAIVYVQLQDDDGQGSSGTSAPVSVLVDENGFWFTDLVNMRSADLSAVFDYSASGDLLIVSANGAADGSADQTVDTGDDTPATDMILQPSVTATPTATTPLAATPTPTSTLAPPTISATPTSTSSPTVTPTATPEYLQYLPLIARNDQDQ